MKYIVLLLVSHTLAACTDTRKKDMEFCQREGGELLLTNIPVFGTVVGCVMPKDWGK